MPATDRGRRLLRHPGAIFTMATPHDCPPPTVSRRASTVAPLTRPPAIRSLFHTLITSRDYGHSEGEVLLFQAGVFMGKDLGEARSRREDAGRRMHRPATQQEKKYNGVFVFNTEAAEMPPRSARCPLRPALDHPPTPPTPAGEAARCAFCARVLLNGGAEAGAAARQRVYADAVCRPREKGAFSQRRCGVAARSACCAPAVATPRPSEEQISRPFSHALASCNKGVTKK